MKTSKSLILFKIVHAKNKVLQSMLANGNFSFGSGHLRMETTCQILTIFIKLSIIRLKN